VHGEPKEGQRVSIFMSDGASTLMCNEVCMGSIHSVRGSRPVVGRLAHTARHRKSEIGLGGVTLRVSHRK
jgi:hypothetical protein